MKPTLIYCAGKNPRFDETAKTAGFKLGAQLPCNVYFPLYFADQNWKQPDRTAYMAALAKHRPTMATVLDWERQEQLDTVLDWAEEAAQYVQDVILIPKVIGGVPCLPRQVAGKRIVLGYSVPTRYAGTQVPLWEFAGWPIHLLGGSPHKQMEIWHYLTNIAEVISTDGNMANKMATHCRFWREQKGNNGHWVTLIEADRQPWGHDAPYEAFRRSCHNIAAVWIGREERR